MSDKKSATPWVVSSKPEQHHIELVIAIGGDTIYRMDSHRMQYMAQYITGNTAWIPIYGEPYRLIPVTGAAPCIEIKYRSMVCTDECVTVDA